MNFYIPQCQQINRSDTYPLIHVSNEIDSFNISINHQTRISHSQEINLNNSENIFFDIPRPPAFIFDSTEDNTKIGFHVMHSQNTTIPRITVDEFISIYGNPGKIEQLFIIDCRFQEEYDAGHIYGAYHVNNELFQQFFSNEMVNTLNKRSPENKNYNESGNTLNNSCFVDNRIIQSTQKPLKDIKILIIFHCEFSHQRGPELASIFRKIDRKVNSYPNLFYPDVYVLDGGIANVYYKEPNLILNHYLKMEHIDASLIRRRKSERKKFVNHCHNHLKQTLKENMLQFSFNWE
ncbi:hypothetical protein TRFO_31034 [Tritrichomonas foetus]|uniref:Rhodanese domain-containing protein n=1 Tax=Tritrichomonas foetus TaxID=1144522 RepID=A0A1J4JWQ3_9EUKA|nr:hypothetical protein TRFO_31034 [Tritrichomonas foetus]|eukprot:OHT01964.1 hypothetical protein TRFO_31034 [Tritrichomonas foetus]